MQLWTEAGIANGLATLGSDSKLAAGQIPTTVAALVSGAPQVGTWTKYAVTRSGTKWAVNGVDGATRASGTSQSLALFTKAPNTVIEKCIVKHSAAFAGTAISAVTASVGIAGSLTGVTSALDIFAAPGSTGFVEGEGSLDLGSIGVVLAFTSTGGNLSVLSAGAVDVWVKTSVLP